MRSQRRVGVVDLHMGDDDADQRRKRGEIAQAVKHVDNQRESIVRDVAITGPFLAPPTESGFWRASSIKRHGRTTPD
jgi:hypothetical protein